MEYEDFESKVGTVFTVQCSQGSFDMELLEVEKGEKRQIKPKKWKPKVEIREQPFSLLFESEQKIMIREMVKVSGGGFADLDLTVEPIDESEKGYIYEVCIG